MMLMDGLANLFGYPSPLDGSACQVPRACPGELCRGDTDREIDIYAKSYIELPGC